jgi:uncharacterized protein
MRFDLILVPKYDAKLFGRLSACTRPVTELSHRALFLDGAVGRLEAVLWSVPPDQASHAAVVCHPHPLFGGTLHNKVVYQTAKTLHERGWPVLRFNFRGAGLSEGTHDRGRGEQDDVRAAIDYLAQEFPGRPILLAGFSFGSWVGSLVAVADARVKEFIGLGLPVDNTDMSYLADSSKPKLIVQGGSDKFGSRKNVEMFFAALREPKRLVIVEGADHFFTHRLDEVAAAINSWLDDLESAPRD